MEAKDSKPSNIASDALLKHTSSRLGSTLLCLWIVLLVLPAATTFSASHSWDVNQLYLFATSCWLIIMLRLLIPDSLFFPITYPIALLGLSCVAADFTRNVDLLEIAAQWRTFAPSDVSATLRPYRLSLPSGAALLAVLCWQAFRLNTGKPVLLRHWRLTVVSIGSILLLFFAPILVWGRAWPINGVLIVASIVGDAPALSKYSTQSSVSVNPRSPSATWRASRTAAPPKEETYLLVIGETLRSDYLRECGGPNAVRLVTPGAIVACDVTAGSNATHTSVPLLVSREMPGHPVRVSSDGTFQKAFAEVGFTTHWYGVQGDAIAWPDAGVQKYPTGPDRSALLPLLDGVLSNEKKHQSIVLHTYGAHEPYCTRFNRLSAPYPDECDKLGGTPTATNITRWHLMYANAVDDSVGFLNEVITKLQHSPGQVFLAFTSDHGENLLDDHRNLYGHALRHPTCWDVRVPVVFWANTAWKEAHQAEWRTLEKNVSAPLMHADIVPTLLGAAGIRYHETRDTPINLLERTVPIRNRQVQTSIGASTNWEVLINESQQERWNLY